MALIVLLLLLILINGFFAGTEAAVAALNAAKLRKLAEDGDRSAQKLLKLTEEPDRFLSAARMGTTFAGFLASALAALYFPARLTVWLGGELGVTLFSGEVLYGIFVVLAALIATCLMLVFGSLVPGRLAAKHAHPWMKAAYGVMSAVSVLLWPFVKLTAGLAGLLLKLFHLKAEKETEDVTEEEIRMMVDIGEEKGNIDVNEKEWIQNIFDFDDVSIRRIMTPRTDVIAFSLEDDREEILKTIEETGLSRYPVYGEDMDDIEGILYARDYLLAVSRGEEAAVKDIVRPAYFVPESMHADVLFAELQKKKTHIAVIIDEYGAMEGIVTMEDLVEEIVGNIYDEFDPEEEPEIIKMDEGLFKVTGNTTIDDLAEELDMELDMQEEDYDTVGGLIISLLQAIPQDGEGFDVEGFGLHVHVEGSDIKDRRIERAYISILKKKEDSEEDEAL